MSSSALSPTATLQTATVSRAISLLGSGFAPETVAAALGVTPSRISQLISDPAISQQISELKYQNLSCHSLRDAALDSLEDHLIKKTESLLPLISRPIEAARILSLVNGAKRRGPPSDLQQTNHQTIVNVVLPAQIALNFTKNSSGQVVEITHHPSGDQSTSSSQNLPLITIEPEALKTLHGSHSSSQAATIASNGEKLRELLKQIRSRPSLPTRSETLCETGGS